MSLLLTRLLTKQACRKYVNLGSVSVFVRPVTFKSEPYKPVTYDNFDMYNRGLKRPLSPHLTIYTPELTSMLSITHRASGAALTGMVMFFGIGTLLIRDFGAFIDWLNPMLPYFIITFVKFVISLGYAYHVVNGIRHLLWDVGKFLDLKSVYITGYIMLVGVFAVTGVLTFLL